MNTDLKQALPRRLRGRRMHVPDTLRSPLTVIGAVVILFWIVVIVFGPAIQRFDPLAQDGIRLSAPDAVNWFGTDTLGRDLFSRVIAGARVSIPAAVVVVAICATVGSIIGAMAGYFGGWLDEVFMRVTDLVFAFPSTILAMVISASLGPNIQNAVISIALVNWPTYARLVRSLVIGYRNSEFVVFGRLLGTGPMSSLFRDIFPNAIPHILVIAFVDFGDSLLLLSGLSFLGLGATPPTPEWGQMVSEGVSRWSSWWLAFFPGFAILTIVLAVNFIGDAVRDWFDRTHDLVKAGE